MTNSTPAVATPAPTRSLWADAIRQTFTRNGARIGLVWIVIMAIFASFGPLLTNSLPFYARMADGTLHFPLFANLTVVDCVWLLLPLATILSMCVRGVAVNQRILAVAAALIVALPIAFLRMAGSGFAFVSTNAGYLLSLPLFGLLLAVLLIAGTVLLRAAFRSPRLGLVTVAPVALCGVAILLFNPQLQQNLDYAQWREARASGQVTSYLYPINQFSPNDRMRDVSQRVDQDRMERRAAQLEKRDPKLQDYPVYGPIPERGVDLQPPNRIHWMGTTFLGEDMLSRMIGACRIALTIGIISTGIATAIGVVIGSLMGYFGGWLDLLGMRAIEILESLPRLLILLIITVSIGRNLYLMMCVIGLLGWMGDARFVRAEFLRLRKLDFVQAGVALGLPKSSIVFKHMLPNGIAPVLVNASFGIAGAILLESTLSFLGLGLEASEPSWGQLLEQARQGTSGFNWWIALFPGGAIFLTVFSYILIGEAMRDALDPKLKKRE
jgi:peptide/nickel transport system permease protein